MIQGAGPGRWSGAGTALRPGERWAERRRAEVVATGPGAAKEPDMLDQLSQALIAIVNGLQAGLGAALELRTVLVIVTVLGLGWLAAVEIEELDRRGVKPSIRRH